jgi:hypothetical protein
MSTEKRGRLATLIRELGWLNALLYASDLLVWMVTRRRLLTRYYIVAQPVSGRPLISPRRGTAISVRELDADAPALRELPLTPEVIRFRFAQKSVCLGAFKNGRIVGCLWLCRGPYVEDEIRCRFDPRPPGRAAWDYDVYVHPDCRVGLVFARLWEAANEYLRANGYDWSVSRISAFNPRSLASHTRLGAVPCGSLVVVHFGRVQVTFSTFRPRVHVSTGPRSVPQFAITVDG